MHNYEEELPIEDYIYTEAVKERHEDIQRFKELIANEGDDQEASAIELLYVSKRLFYNHFGLDKILACRTLMLNFFDVEINDDIISKNLNAGNAENDELIDEVLNSLTDIDDLKKLNPKKLANRYPELPFLSLVKIIYMEIMEEPDKKIQKQLDEALSIYPEDILLKLHKETTLNRNEQQGSIINQSLFEHQTASTLLGTDKIIHSFELMCLHNALYEYLINEKEILMLDALMFASQTLFPEWEDAWSDKEVYSEILKVEFCKLIIGE